MNSKSVSNEENSSTRSSWIQIDKTLRQDWTEFRDYITFIFQLPCSSITAMYSRRLIVIQFLHQGWFDFDFTVTRSTNSYVQFTAFPAYRFPTVCQSRSSAVRGAWIKYILSD